MNSIQKRFQELNQLPGEIYREQPGRKTFATQINGEDVFVKLHFGVGWQEILKNILRFAKPVLGARDEFQALKALHQLNIATMDVEEFGEYGVNPAHQCSYLVTKALKNTISLEDLTADWLTNSPSIKFKRQLIFEVARMAAVMHKNGINHRDFYICHFLFDKQYYQEKLVPKLYLIDLHRAQIRTKTPWRWQVKDIAGLYFSSLRIGLTRRDFFYFMQVYVKYFNEPSCNFEKFWFEVEKRAWPLYEKTYYSLQKHGLKRMRFDATLPQQMRDIFFAEPDGLMKQSRVLKEDTITTVVHYQYEDKNYIIKRYNARTFKTWFKRFFRSSRARRCWLQAMRLNQLGIKTPPAHAMLTHALVNRSYLMTEFLLGNNLAEAINFQPQSLSHWQVEMKEVFQALQQTYTAHGDMKAPNILCHQQDVYLLDLDGSKRCQTKQELQKAFVKDRNRFLKNWRDNPMLLKAFEAIF